MEDIDGTAWLVCAIKAEDGPAWIWAKPCVGEGEASRMIAPVAMELGDALREAARQPQPGPDLDRDPQDFFEIYVMVSTPATRRGLASECLLNATRYGKSLDLAWCARQAGSKVWGAHEARSVFGPFEVSGFDSEAECVKLGLAFVRAQSEAKEMEAAIALGRSRGPGKLSL